jgi:ssDNA-binding Zn-finger/Zn-ribbon topoisomerase 1
MSPEAFAEAQRSYGVRCGDCGAAMVLRFGGAGSVRKGYFWGCPRYPACRATLGADPVDGSPRGYPADEKTRRARQAAHRAFDAAWQARGMTRTEAYAWLHEMMRAGAPNWNERTHISKFSERQCLHLIVRIEIAEAVRKCLSESDS